MNAALGKLMGWFALGGADRKALPVRDRVDIAGARPVRLLAFDQTLLAVVAALVMLGVVMVYSASVALPDNPRFAAYSPGFFLQRHLLSLAIAFVVAVAVVQVPMSLWEQQAPIVFVVALILLALVLVPFIGKVVNFSRRWIPLGFMNFQPSELAKLAIALYADQRTARGLVDNQQFVGEDEPRVEGGIGRLAFPVEDLAVHQAVAGGEFVSHLDGRGLRKSESGGEQDEQRNDEQTHIS